jgi:DNA-binding response OmpR family regulator
MDVVWLRWPSEQDRRSELREGNVPRLFLVEGDTSPPPLLDVLEDWIRVPADEVDLQARLENLSRRARVAEGVRPEVDEHGVLRFHDRLVSLSPVEARLAGALVERFGTVTSRDALTRVGWPEGVPSRNVVDVMMLRLRRRLEPLSLTIRTVRSRGYLLQVAPEGGRGGPTS